MRAIWRAGMYGAACVNQSTGLILGVCGLSVACAGVLVFLALAFFRLTGRSVPALLPGRGEPGTAAKLPRRRRINLRAKAQAVDFDSALRAQPGNDALSDPRLPPSSSFDRPSPRRDLRSRSRLRRHDDDEVFGGLLDADGDGSPDL